MKRSLATTEIHRIDWDGGSQITLTHCSSGATIGEEEASREGLSRLIHTIVLTEIEIPDPDPRSLTISAAVLDAEAQMQEERETLLRSLCAQCEVFFGQTPFAERMAG